MATRTWEVWDTLNADGADGDFWTIEADDAKAAALSLAEQCGGVNDGLFVTCSQPIAVRSTATGAVRVFEVRAEMVPEFRATEREEPS